MGSGPEMTPDMTRHGLRARLRRILNRGRNEDGGVSVEFVLWLPIYVIILTLTVDTSLLFLGQSGLWNAAHDTSRQLSMGEMTEAEGEAYAATKAAYWADNATVDATVLTDRVEVMVSVPANELAIFGFLGVGKTFNVVARTIHMMEPGSV